MVPLDPRLTEAVPEPADPPFRCVDTSNRRTVCNEDATDWGMAMRTAYRKVAAKLDAILKLQPEVQ